MKRIAAVLAFSLLASGAAFAQSAPNNDHNTFVVTEANGAVVRYHFNSDGTWDAAPPSGAAINGTYTINGAQICITTAGSTQPPQCVDNNTGKHVGDTWTQKAADGTNVTVSLVAGRP